MGKRVWRIARPVCLLLIGVEFWALLDDNRLLLHLSAVLALGVLVIAWVLTPDEKGER